MRRTSLGLVVWMACCALMSGGCSDDLGGRQPISGTVTLKGQPIEEGVISFEALGETATAKEVTASGAPIKDGKYEIPVEQGLLPGHYRVRITAGDGVTPSNADELPGPATRTTNITSKDLIPAAYGWNSTQEVEVKTGQPGKFDFPIP